MREGRKEGDCLLQPSSSDFPIVFRDVTFVSMVVLSVGRSGRSVEEERMERMESSEGKGAPDATSFVSRTKKSTCWNV